MNIMDYSLDIDDLVVRIQQMGWKRIGLQFPEGVKPYADEIIQLLQTKRGSNERRNDIEFILSGSSCYGACDLADHELRIAGAEGMIHFGHSEIPNLTKDSLIPVIFQEMRSNIDPLSVVKKAYDGEQLSGIVGLTTTVQHIHLLPRVRNFLHEKGMDVRIGTGSDRLAYPGQVLGCSFSSATAVNEADMHLFIGEGIFHPLGIALATGKPVIAADPRSGEIKNMEQEKERILRQRFAAVQKLGDARKIGVILSTLQGQKRQEFASSLLKKGRKHGKDMVLITVSHLNVRSLVNLGTKVLVSTACPRVAIDDYRMYLEHGITITTPIELLIALGEMEWEEYVLDTIE